MSKELLDKTIAEVTPVSEEWINKAFERLDSLTKPKRSLGYLEEMAARYVAINEEERPVVGKKRVVVFVGDHKVVEEGVSAYPQEVTGLMVKNFIGGGAAINVLAKCAGADVQVVDIGMMEDLGQLQGLTRRNVKRGADNIAQGAAMSIEEALSALSVGIDLAAAAAADGVSVIGTGDMGIGNTTPASALFAAYLNMPPAEVVGPGTGLDPEGVERKTQIVKKAVETNDAACVDPLTTLASLGGLEIAGICGLCLGAAARRMAIIVDGLISTAGALAAIRLCPAAKQYMFFAHMSAEPGHRKFFEKEEIRPVIDLGMRLGEGTGAAIAMQVMENAMAVYNDMATFADVGITPGA